MRIRSVKTGLIFIVLCSTFMSRANAQGEREASAGNVFKRVSSAITDRIPRISVAGKQKDHVPQLGRIYSRAAQAVDGHRNPIIVIPGILGSKLVDSKTKKVAWGTVRLSESRIFPGGQSVDLALPMRSGVQLNSLRDNIIAAEILDDLELNVLGWPVQIQAYSEILSTLGVGGYRSGAGATLANVDYGRDHFTCFEFHYDWRRDCSENAAELDRFIQAKTDYVRAERAKRFGASDEPIRFDIVAHSMGGLVARYFLRYGNAPLPTSNEPPTLTWAGASKVETLVLVGTPNGGSVLAFNEMVNGLQFSKAFPKHEAATVGTLPSTYQLLPRPRHHTVIDHDSGQRLNLYDWRTWQKYGWGLLNPSQDPILRKLLPGVDAATRKQVATDHVQKCLWQAFQFHRALDVPAKPPEGTSIFLIAGDSEMTDSKISASLNAHKIAVVEQAPGDGTVTRSSTLMDERLSNDRPWTPRLRSPISWSGTTFIFTDHLGLTSSPAFTDNALYLLLERPR